MAKPLYPTRTRPERRFVDEDGLPRRPVRAHKQSESLPSDINPVVIFMASSTPEKLRDMRLIAEQKHLPLVFEDIHKVIGTFHSVDEDAEDFAGNAAKKLGALDFAKLRTGKYAEHIKEYLSARGLADDCPIYFATEDGGFSVEKAVWDKTNTSGIPDYVLRRIHDQGEFTGPGVETGPAISGALGSNMLMQRVLKAAKDAEKDPSDVRIQEFSTMTLAPISKESTDPDEVLRASTLHQLHEPSTLAISEQRAHQKISTHHYLAHPGQTQSLAEIGEEAIVKYSPKAQLIDQISMSFFGPNPPHYEHDFRKRDLLKDDKFRIGSFGADGHAALEKMQTLFDQHGLYKDYFLHVPASLAAGSDAPQNTYELLSNVEAMMKDSDAAVLLPDAAKKPDNSEPASLQELMKLYTLFSLEVARQLNSRDMDKPVFIMNHDGSWDNALAIHHDLTNSNMTKEYNISPPALSVDEAGKVRVRSTSYFDVLEGHDGKPVSFEDTQQVLLRLLNEKRKGYTRRHTTPDEVIEHGLTPDNNSTPAFKVAMFCSASSENAPLNRSIKQLSHDLVADDFGIIYGGGDRYTMGAVLDGVVQYRQELKAKDPGLSDDFLKYKAWIAGYSTKQILQSETKLGKFSGELSYTKRTADIYQRMADMLEHCDAVVAAPGGAGTVQEWAAALILNKLHPDNAKPIVFYDPPLNSEQHQVWSTSLRLLLGEKDYTLLTSDSIPADQKLKRSQELGIYIERSDEAVKHRLLELRRERGHARSLERGADTGLQLH